MAITIDLWLGLFIVLIAFTSGMMSGVRLTRPHAPHYQVLRTVRDE